MNGVPQRKDIILTLIRCWRSFCCGLKHRFPLQGSPIGCEARTTAILGIEWLIMNVGMYILFRFSFFFLGMSFSPWHFVIQMEISFIWLSSSFCQNLKWQDYVHSLHYHDWFVNFEFLAIGNIMGNVTYSVLFLLIFLSSI